ncbi:MAG: acetyl-CoA carboxylase biotin carboxyl carrier protein [Jannaschia sp.]
MTKNHDSDVAFIKALAELLRDNDLTEVEVMREYGDDDSLNVRVSRQPAAAPQAAMQYSVPQQSSQTNAPAPAADTATPPSDPAQDPGAVTSPMVGTAYLSPEPSAAAFVQVGDTVSEGQTLLIVEAMKTMNQIPSPRSGKVKRILVEDGAAVEYGAPLVILT